MNLYMDISVAERYHSASQRIKAITENWVGNTMYCPCCGAIRIEHAKNNSPVKDFLCKSCSSQFELKSKAGTISNKIVDGAYCTMINRINAIDNPSFFFMRYDKTNYKVKDFMLVPKYFFVNDIIEKRKPLADTAIRAGWIGCNIIVKKIPDEGKIFIIKNEKVINKADVCEKYNRTNFVSEYNLQARGWILDIFNCLSRIDSREFVLDDMYKFAEELQKIHPENHHVKDKIRQQLQLLRDKDIIEFIGRGRYRKI